MRRSLLSFLVALVLASSLMTATPAVAAAPRTPNAITALTARPGPGIGEVTFTWTHDGRYTTGFVLETGLNSFSKTDSSMPSSGRNATFFQIPASARTYTLTADQMATAGARVSSGNHLYFRMSAVNKDPYGATATRYFPSLQAVLPRPMDVTDSWGKMRVASFNIRTARATTDKQTWMQRVPAVAQLIMQYKPGVVAMQELGPGRADGKTGTLQGTQRQTDSMTAALDKIYGQRYDLVRTTPYVPVGTPTDTQGARILYDHDKYRLVSNCPEKTGTQSYSSSCSINLPLMLNDSEEKRRRAAYAEFEDRASKQRFYFVSLHLDVRHSTNPDSEVIYNRLRGKQVDAVIDTIAELNTDNEPVIVGGDFNSWQNNRYGNAPHDTLVDHGFYDTSAAVVRKNFQYTTVNHYETTIKPASQGVGVRLDQILVKGARGSAYFENVMKVTDSMRPSDHNMIVTDIAPFSPWRGGESRTARVKSDPYS